MKKLHNRKKNLGQYFTGKALARLLAHLSFDSTFRKIIDPMCGTGDMLKAYAEINANVSFHGIEIDPIIYPYLREKLSKLTNNQDLHQGNAFDLNVLQKLNSFNFDLVITNPPYVRYQRLTQNSSVDLSLLNSQQIRDNLLKFNSKFPFEDEGDRSLFQELISHYSGLSDLAVPSWILCAMLTRIGGTLAMVVPETWLSRDYAVLIQYLLLRWFKIKFIIEDIHSSWFSDAQVKTTLLIAERINRKPSAFLWNNEDYFHIGIASQAKTKESIIGNIYPDCKIPERSFINDLKKAAFMSNELANFRKSKLSERAASLKTKAIQFKWFYKLENTSSFSIKNFNEKHQKIPGILKQWLKESEIKFQFLEDFGVKTGQGLRTGANKFFYVDIKKQKEDGWEVYPNSAFTNKTIFVPNDCLNKVLRKQAELEAGYRIDAYTLKGGVLTFKNKILKEDFENLKEINSAFPHNYSILPEELGYFIKQVSLRNIGSLSVPKYIPQLSAVAPNVRKWSATKPNLLPRFWYMLPPFKERHTPDLFVARINNKHPKTILNSEPKVLIDANFSSFWIIKEIATIDKYALLALMNSAWIHSVMELTATVMGGGALKLEATHLRNIPIPKLQNDVIKYLSELGLKLAEGQDIAKTLMEINTYLTSIFFKKDIVAQKIKELHSIKNQKLNQRLK